MRCHRDNFNFGFYKLSRKHVRDEWTHYVQVTSLVMEWHKENWLKGNVIEVVTGDDITIWEGQELEAYYSEDWDCEEITHEQYKMVLTRELL